MYALSNLRLRDVEELEVERGIVVFYEMIRRWMGVQTLGDKPIEKFSRYATPATTS